MAWWSDKKDIRALIKDVKDKLDVTQGKIYELKNELAKLHSDYKYNATKGSQERAEVLWPKINSKELELANLQSQERTLVAEAKNLMGSALLTPDQFSIEEFEKIKTAHGRISAYSQAQGRPTYAEQQRASLAKEETAGEIAKKALAEELERMNTAYQAKEKSYIESFRKAAIDRAARGEGTYDELEETKIQIGVGEQLADQKKEIERLKEQLRNMEKETKEWKGIPVREEVSRAKEIAKTIAPVVGTAVATGVLKSLNIAKSGWRFILFIIIAAAVILAVDFFVLPVYGFEIFSYVRSLAPGVFDTLGNSVCWIWPPQHWQLWTDQRALEAECRGIDRTPQGSLLEISAKSVSSHLQVGIGLAAINDVSVKLTDDKLTVTGLEIIPKILDSANSSLVKDAASFDVDTYSDWRMRISMQEPTVCGSCTNDKEGRQICAKESKPDEKLCTLQKNSLEQTATAWFEFNGNAVLQDKTGAEFNKEKEGELRKLFCQDNFLYPYFGIVYSTETSSQPKAIAIGDSDNVAISTKLPSVNTLGHVKVSLNFAPGDTITAKKLPGRLGAMTFIIQNTGNGLAEVDSVVIRQDHDSKISGITLRSCSGGYEKKFAVDDQQLKLDFGRDKAILKPTRDVVIGCSVVYPDPKGETHDIIFTPKVSYTYKDVIRPSPNFIEVECPQS